MIRRMDVPVTIPRKLQISLEQTRYYHCTSRCVRRAYLCGKDPVTGRSYEHRRRWIEERLQLVSSAFAIDVAAYAVMHNHYHVVLRINPERVSSWSDTEVRERWSKLFSVPVDTDVSDRIPVWRERLMSISWFMRCINEYVARRANKEDECSGRFWEGRFGLQALLDETAVYRCMVYVDLNPVRSGIEALPENSAYTSIKSRIEHRDMHLIAFKDRPTSVPESLPMSHGEYLELVDWTGRIVRPDKKGHVPDQAPPILERIGAYGRNWPLEIRNYRTWFHRAAGSISALERYCAHLQQHWLKGMNRERGKPV